MKKTQNAESRKPQNADRPSKNALSGRCPDLNLKNALDIATEAIKRAYIKLALEQTGGNINRAAALLGLSRRGIRYAMRTLGFDAQPFSAIERSGQTPKSRRQPKIDVAKLLPSPTEREMLIEDFERGNFDDIETLADDYGMSVETVREIIKAESNTSSQISEDGNL